MSGGLELRAMCSGLWMMVCANMKEKFCWKSREVGERKRKKGRGKQCLVGPPPPRFRETKIVLGKACD